MALRSNGRPSYGAFEPSSTHLRARSDSPETGAGVREPLVEVDRILCRQHHADAERAPSAVSRAFEGFAGGRVSRSSM
jgi:hypothetical protein